MQRVDHAIVKLNHDLLALYCFTVNNNLKLNTTKISPRHQSLLLNVEILTNNEKTNLVKKYNVTLGNLYLNNGFVYLELQKMSNFQLLIINFLLFI